MSSPPSQKSVLAAGLDPNSAFFARQADKPQNSTQRLGHEQKKADEADSGLALHIWVLDPDTTGDWRKEWTDLVTSRHWDAISIGGGLRRHFELTGQFEYLVNVARESAPGSVLVFPTRPDGIVERVGGYFEGLGA